MAFLASYMDGRSARERLATVLLEQRRVIVELDDGRRLFWPAADVRDADPPEATRPGIRLCRVGTEERLSLPEAEAAKAIRAFCPNLKGRRGEGHTAWKPILLWGSAAVFSVALLFWVFLPALAGAIATSIPPDTAHRFGGRLVPEIAEVFGAHSGSTKPCGDSETNAALAALTDRLRPASTEIPVPLRVWVVRAPMVNAVALPGGHVVVFSGLLDFVESGDELAGVLAHEIGHVILRHPIRITVERATVSAFFGLFFGDITGGTMLAGVASALLGNAYSRDMEREADELGTDLMRENALDPRALGSFFERMKKRYGKLEEMMGFFSTHPSTAERAAAIGETPDRVRPIDPGQWEAVRNICGPKD